MKHREFIPSTVAIAFASIASSPASAGIVFDPVPGTGNFTTLLNGGFESGSMQGWSPHIAPSLGAFVASTDEAFVGAWSAKSVPTQTFSGSGFDALGDPVSVVPGETYVLSGFFHTEQMTSGLVYLDLNDVPFEAPAGNFVLGEPGSEEYRSWFFAWRPFTVPTGTSSVRVRLVCDSDAIRSINQGEHAFIDAVAVTLASEFVPPMGAAGISYCHGDGLDVQVTAPCPCANFGDSGRGCANSNAALGGARLAVTGSQLPNTIVLSCDGIPNNSLSTFLRGTTNDPDGVVFGDGVKCVSGTVSRFGQQSAGQGGNAPNAVQSGTGTVAAGNTRYYQVHYRNPSATFCPPESFNVSNGIRIVW